MLPNNQRLVGNLRNLYETSKLAKELNSKVIQDVSPTDTRIRYNRIVNKPA